jgi:O-antigen/teichoic acid export membrane protein
VSNPPTRSAGRQLADGALRGFGAEALLLPTGLVTAAVLGRVLGPADYGLFSLVSSIIGWVTLSSSALLGRATIKLVSEATDWRPIGSMILRTRLSIGGGLAVLLVASAYGIERVFAAPGLAPLLSVFALDVVLFNVVRAHRETLTGVGQYRAVASISMVRWLVRMLLIVALVLWTRSVMAAVVASILTTAVELVVARQFLSVPLRTRGGPSTGELWSVAAPLLVFGLTFQLHSRLDLFAVTALQRGVATVARDTGWYGAAQNLSIVPGLFMMTVSPLLLATLGRLQRDGAPAEAKVLAGDALRLTLTLLPGVAIVVVCASELVRWIFAAPFAGAADLLRPLFAAGYALCVVAVSASILIAAERARVVSWLGIMLVTMAAIGHLVIVPRYGAMGAALVTLGSAIITGVVALTTVVRVWPTPVLLTLARASLVTALVWAAGSRVETTTWWGLLLKLALLSVGAVVGLWVVGEFPAPLRARVRQAFARPA